MSLYLTFQQKHLPFVEQEMLTFIEKHTTNTRLKEAMCYSITAGGKRLRPLLVLAVIDSFGKKIELKDYQIAAALEMTHTYSLIHDDLPAMDDDDLRRGKPTNHKVYGEAHAILAGDALLTAAFHLVAMSQVEANEKILLLQLLAQVSGGQGMIAGQAFDLQGENQKLSVEELAQVHELKTGALMEFALMSGGILAQQPEEMITLLGNFAQHLGLAFQIRDDVLDVVSSKEVLGKNIGRDESLNKSTYPSLLGLDGAKQALTQQINQGKKYLYDIQQINPTFQGDLLLNIIEQLEIG